MNAVETKVGNVEGNVEGIVGTGGVIVSVGMIVVGI